MSVAARVQLALPPEPAELRAWTRAMVEAAPGHWAKLVAGGQWIGVPLWERWGPELEHAGLDRPAFDGILAGYERELWLWVMGERTWAQCADGLAGRVRRRLPG
jgi:hypothetical protein